MKNLPSDSLASLKDNMKNIESELDLVISKEGGYSFDPKDSGGETIWGITKFTATAFGYTGNMKDMSRLQAKEIYRSQYWISPKFHKVFDISPEISFELFDTGINMGVGTAGRMLQRALNALNNECNLYPDMVVDGAIGNMTLTSLKTFLSSRGEDGEVVLLRALNSLQCVRYIELTESRPKDERFVYGWILNRVN